MTKRKRTTAASEALPKPEKFVSRLAKSLSKHYQTPSEVKGQQIAAAFQAALSSVPAGSKLQQDLQQSAAVYTKLLYTQLVDAIQSDWKPTSPAKRAKQSPQQGSLNALLLHLDRSGSSIEAQAEQCQRSLAVFVQLQTTSATQAQPGLQDALQALKSLLCSAAIKDKMPPHAATMPLIQRLSAQLMSMCLLCNKDESHAKHRLGQHQLDHHMLAQAVVLAAEVRQTVSSKGQDYYVALAAHDIKAVGCGCATIFEALLASELSCCWPAQSQEAGMLWQTMYMAALQCIPQGVTPMEYLILIAAAKKVSRVCCSNNFEAAATLASIPAPLLLLTWLQQQPASIVTKDCQHAAQKGAMALTHHLLHSETEDSLAALRQAMVASSTPTGAEKGLQAPDDMLFYVDDARESAFGRGWTDAGKSEQQDEANGFKLHLAPDDLHSSDSE